MMLLITSISLLCIAVLYASVGHGGASGYLAVLALAGEPPHIIRPTALILNILVSSIGLARFAHRGHFRFALLWPFVVTAVPCAFFAGWKWSLDAGVYRAILALILLFAAWRLLVSQSPDDSPSRPLPHSAALIIGAGIGLLSGLIGVGGGIFLSPVLILFRWANTRETAAVSAAFILISSIAGLTGYWFQFRAFDLDPVHLSAFAAAVIVGGFVGATFGAHRFPPIILRRALALVLFIAAAKMFLKT